MSCRQHKPMLLDEHPVGLFVETTISDAEGERLARRFELRLRELVRQLESELRQLHSGVSVRINEPG